MTGRMLSYCCWILLCFAVQVHAAPKKLGTDIPIGLYSDEQGSPLLLEEVADLPDAAFQIQAPLEEIRLAAGSHWLRLQLSNKELGMGAGWIEIKPGPVEQVTLYERPASDTIWHKVDYGPASGGSVMLPIRALQAQGEVQELLIHLRTLAPMRLTAELWRADDYGTLIMRGTVLWSFYFGVALMSTLLALALAVVLRSWTLLAIAAYGFTHVFSGFQVIMGWGLFPIRLPASGMVMAGSMILSDVAMLWLAREALQIRLHFPWVDRAVLALMAVLLLSLLLLPLWRDLPLVMVVYIMAGIGKCLLAILGFRLWYQFGWKYGLMAMAYALLIVASAANFLRSFDWLPFAPFSFLAWQYVTISLVLMICCLLVHGVLRHRQDMLAVRSLGNQLDVEREAGFRQRQFVAMVSHEFRTPLSVISSAARNLQRRMGQDATPQSEDIQLRLRRVIRATGRLVQLTDNCLADARLDKQLDSIERRPIDLLQVVKEAAEIIELSDHHQLRLVCGQWTLDEMAVGVAQPVCSVRGDAALLRIAFSNVLDNAVKYSSSGVITVILERSAQRWRVAVENQGKGVANDLQKVVFEPYVTGGEGQCPNSGSTGLGLSVAKKIARAHRGLLKLESGDPDRTVFAFYFEMNHSHRNRQ